MNTKDAQHRLEYLLVRALEWGAAVLPRGFLLWLGARVGDTAYLVGFNRRVVRKNLEFVGLWSPEDQRRIARTAYRTMGRYALDFMRPVGALPPAVVENEEALVGQTAAGRGVIVLLAHFGNWELLAAMYRPKLPSLTVVAKPMRNPYVEKWLYRHRTETGVDVLFPKMVLRRGLRILKDGGVVAFLIDQYPGEMGTPALFLGKRTSTVRTVAGLTEHTGCAVVGAYALLQPDGGYRVVFQRIPALPEAPAAARNDRVSAIQEQHNTIIGEWITEHPEHWFGWFHRRFKDLISYR